MKKVSRNNISFFHKGKEFYPVLADLIGEAKKEILISVYAFHNDRVGKKFSALLKEKAEQGVKVKVLYDCVGSWGDRLDLLEKLLESGVEAKIFRQRETYLWKHPVSFLYRNHIRLILIDGEYFALGGMAIGEIYENRRDLFALIKNPEADGLRRYFERLFCLADSYEHLNTRENNLESFRIMNGIGGLISGPRPEDEVIYSWILRECDLAKKRLVIVAAWFLPTRELLEKILSAKNRGVEVTIITPLQTDREGYDSFRAFPVFSLLKNGIRWFGTKEYFHQKYIIADDKWCFGSSNFDMLSLNRDYELDIAGVGGKVLESLREDYEDLAKTAKSLDSLPAPYFIGIAGGLLYAVFEYLFLPGKFWPMSSKRPVLSRRY